MECILQRFAAAEDRGHPTGLTMLLRGRFLERTMVLSGVGLEWPFLEWTMLLCKCGVATPADCGHFPGTAFTDDQSFPGTGFTHGSSLKHSVVLNKTLADLAIGVLKTENQRGQAGADGPADSTNAVVTEAAYR